MPPQKKGRGRGVQKQPQGQQPGRPGEPPQQQERQQHPPTQQQRPPQQHYQPPQRRGGGPPGFQERTEDRPGRQVSGLPGFHERGGHDRPSRQVSESPGVQEGGDDQPERSGPTGTRQQIQPPISHEHGEPQVPPDAQKRERTINPEELGFQYEHSMTLQEKGLPKKCLGTKGRPIKLISNCYPLDLPSGNVYHYDIEILSRRKQSTTTLPQGAPIKDKKYRCMNTKRNREVIAAMLKNDPNFNRVLAAYDGRKNLYSRRPLTFITEHYKSNVDVPDQNPGDPDDPRGPRMDPFQVIIKPVKKKETNDCSISLDPLHALFSGAVSSVPNEAVMAVETVLRHGPCMRYTPVGRSFFYPPLPQDIHPLGGGREIWFGYHQSLRLGQWTPMVNLDITATTFYEKGPVLKYVANILKKNESELLRGGPLKDADVVKIGKELKNMRIEVTHLKYRRKYRILRFSRESANSLKFTITENGNDRSTTVARYFAEHYGLRLTTPHLPCIQVNPEAKKIYLPIEVCEMVEGQHCKKKLEDRQNAEMIKFTARPPRARFNEIRELLKRADYSHDEYLREFGMKVCKEPLALEGRVIEPPNVLYKTEDQNTKIKPKDGSWDMRNVQYYRGAEIRSWVLLSFAYERFCPMEQLQKFASLLTRIASEQGIRINRPATIKAVGNTRQTPLNILTDVKKTFGADLVVVVVPGNNKQIYGEVKQAAETNLGLVTQCIKDDSVVKKCNPPLVSNLCQKINAKMGGVNNALTPGETPAILRRPVIIIGADVTHPSPSQDIKPSLAAAVGSLDAHPSRYAVTIRAQTNVDEKKQAIEIILDLKNMVLELLKAFYKNTNGKKPEKIVFYRDGVSEGQFEKVRDHEVKSIREACRTLNVDYQPGITFIVVQKRHHTRFMTQNERDGVGRMKNIPPGTTVDTTVTHPLNYDFFLCSHFGLQGTSRPCHYTVIEDDNKFTADDLQTLTYYLCHTYVRCTKSISSPAPVMYAHLAAFRARQHLLSEMSESSAGSDTSSSTGYHPLPDSVMKAIKVLEDLKNTMYFV